MKATCQNILRAIASKKNWVCRPAHTNKKDICLLLRTQKKLFSDQRTHKKNSCRKKKEQDTNVEFLELICYILLYILIYINVLIIFSCVVFR